MPMKTRHILNWPQVEQRIRAHITPGSKGVLKCAGVERRPVTSNTVQKIGMRTGTSTRQTKAITYEMLRHAFHVLQLKGRFDSRDFRSKFAAEYEAAPCRYSMTGGVLVEIGAATLIPSDGDEECYYLKNGAPAKGGPRLSR